MYIFARGIDVSNFFSIFLGLEFGDFPTLALFLLFYSYLTCYDSCVKLPVQKYDKHIARLNIFFTFFMIGCITQLMFGHRFR